MQTLARKTFQFLWLTLFLARVIGKESLPSCETPSTLLFQDSLLLRLILLELFYLLIIVCVKNVCWHLLQDKSNNGELKSLIIFLLNPLPFIKQKHEKPFLLAMNEKTSWQSLEDWRNMFLSEESSATAYEKQKKSSEVHEAKTGESTYLNN